MPLQHFFVQSRYLGNRQVANFRQDSAFGPRTTESVCWFCPRCGEIWARLAVEGSQYHQHWTEYCPKHGDGRIDRDSRFEWWPCELAADWPDEALRYVLLNELRLAEKER